MRTMDDVFKEILDSNTAIINLISAFNQTDDYDTKMRLIDELKYPIKHMDTNISYLKSALKETLLKPCPFCHGKAELLTDDGGDYGEDHWLVECTNCGCTLSIGKKSEYTEEQAIEFWNTRK